MSMDTTALASASDFEYAQRPAFGRIERWGAFAVAAAMIRYGVTRRSQGGWWLAASAAPLVYRGATGRWPGGLEGLMGSRRDTREALGGSRGVNLRESVRLECPIEAVAQLRRWERTFTIVPLGSRSMKRRTPHSSSRSG